MSIFQNLLTAYGLSHIYAFICLRRAFGGGLWQLPVIAGMAFMALFWVFRWGKSPGPAWWACADLAVYAWMGLFLFCLCALFIGDVLALLSRILSFIIPLAPLKKTAAWLVAPRYVPIALGVGLLFFLYGVVEAHTPRVREITLTTAKLPAGSPPLRIAAVADVHITGFIGPAFLERMAAKVNELEPDIFVSCGDLVDSNLKGKTEEAAALSKIKARLGKFAVTGNHESYRGLSMSLDFMKRSGLRVLRGESVSVGGINLAGVDDVVLASRFPETTSTLNALKKARSDRFTLLLNHHPVWRQEAVGQFDLQYSGHTHGGQIWPGIYLTKKRYRVEQGFNALRNGKKKSLLYVSNGTGYWGPPIRFLASPEITLIIVKPE